MGPDFRVYEDGVCVGGVEVLSVFQREDWSVAERRHWRLADELNRRILPTDGYFVDFEIEEALRDPPPKRVADFVKRELARLPPHEKLLYGLGDRVTRAELPSAIYCRDGVHIRMSFLPMVAGAGAKSDPDSRIVGTGPVIGGMVNSAERLRDRIIAKAGGRYDIADVPFVVAVGVHDTLCSDDQVLQALYGGESVVVETAQLTRRNDGLFGADREHREGRHRRVSGVAVVNGLRPWQPRQVDLAFYDNPHAARPAPEDLISASRRFGPAGRTEVGVRFDWRAGS